MIIATPDGKFYSETWPETNGYKHTIREVTKNYVKYLCQNSKDFVIHRRLTNMEKLRLYTKR